MTAPADAKASQPSSDEPVSLQDEESVDNDEKDNHADQSSSDESVRSMVKTSADDHAEGSQPCSDEPVHPLGNDGMEPVNLGGIFRGLFGRRRVARDGLPAPSSDEPIKASGGGRTPSISVVLGEKKKSLFDVKNVANSDGNVIKICADEEADSLGEGEDVAANALMLELLLKEKEIMRQEKEDLEKLVSSLRLRNDILRDRLKNHTVVNCLKEQFDQTKERIGFLLANILRRDGIEKKMKGGIRDRASRQQSSATMPLSTHSEISNRSMLVSFASMCESVCETEPSTPKGDDDQSVRSQEKQQQEEVEEDWQKREEEDFQHLDVVKEEEELQEQEAETESQKQHEEGKGCFQNGDEVEEDIQQKEEDDNLDQQEEVKADSPCPEEGSQLQEVAQEKNHKEGIPQEPKEDKDGLKLREDVQEDTQKQEQAEYNFQKQEREVEEQYREDWQMSALDACAHDQGDLHSEEDPNEMLVGFPTRVDQQSETDEVSSVVTSINSDASICITDDDPVKEPEPSSQQQQNFFHNSFQILFNRQGSRRMTEDVNGSGSGTPKTTNVDWNDSMTLAESLGTESSHSGNQVAEGENVVPRANSPAVWLTRKRWFNPRGPVVEDVKEENEGGAEMITAS